MPDLSKLDAPMRRLLAKTVDDAEAETGDDVVAVFVGGTGAFTDEQLEVLRADGVQIRTVVDDILTADADVRAVTEMCGLDFVRSVSLSSDLPREGAGPAAEAADAAPAPVFYDAE